MPEPDEERVDLPSVLHERIDDVRYVCEAHGWGDLLYLLDIVGHELKTRLAASTQMSVDLSDASA